jgi:hypothetical protein
MATQRGLNSALKFSGIAGGLYGFANEAKRETAPTTILVDFLLPMTVVHFLGVDSLITKKQVRIREISNVMTKSTAFAITGIAFGANFYIGNQVGRLGRQALNSLF